MPWHVEFWFPPIPHIGFLLPNAFLLYQTSQKEKLKQQGIQNVSQISKKNRRNKETRVYI